MHSTEIRNSGDMWPRSIGPIWPKAFLNLLALFACKPICSRCALIADQNPFPTDLSPRSFSSPFCGLSHSLFSSQKLRAHDCTNQLLCLLFWVSFFFSVYELRYSTYFAPPPMLAQHIHALDKISTCVLFFHDHIEISPRPKHPFPLKGRGQQRPRFEPEMTPSVLFPQRCATLVVYTSSSSVTLLPPLHLSSFFFSSQAQDPRRLN